MTLPDERYRALRQVPSVLRELAATRGPVRKWELRSLVAALLRHYPLPSELEQIARACPQLLDSRED